MPSPAMLATARLMLHVYECLLGKKAEDLGPDGPSQSDCDFINLYLNANRRRDEALIAVNAAQSEIDALEQSCKPIAEAKPLDAARGLAQLEKLIGDVNEEGDK